MRQHPIHEEFPAARVCQAGGFEKVWTDAGLFAELRRPQSGGACAACGVFASCLGGCMAKLFTGLPLDGPDPECVQGHGAEALKGADPGPAPDHSYRGPARARAAVVRGCDESPLAGFISTSPRTHAGQEPASGRTGLIKPAR
jgi:radical SAM protein with 4Fe4S-binding SPASM domain